MTHPSITYSSNYSASSSMAFHFIVILIGLIHTSSIAQAQSGWFSLNTGTTSYLYDIHFLNNQTGYVVGQFGTILKTLDGGANWITFNLGANYNFFSVYFINPDTGYTAGYNKVFKTSNGGTDWFDVSPVSLGYADVFFVSDNTGFLTTTSNIFKTTNAGVSWFSIYNYNSAYLYDITFFNENTGYVILFVVTPWIYQVLKTTDGGNNWSMNYSIPSNYSGASLFFVNATTGFVLSQNTLSRTVNGTDWNTIVLDMQYNYYHSLFFFNASTGYLTADYGRILKTTNGGINLVDQSLGAGGSGMSAIYFTDNNTGYVAGPNGFMKKTTNGGEPIGIEPISGEVPLRCELRQNYPNPFNASTNIRFDLPLASKTILRIYDILGREVVTLVNERLSPGRYELEWDGSEFASGIYFYELRAGDFAESRKMLLVK